MCKRTDVPKGQPRGSESCDDLLAIEDAEHAPHALLAARHRQYRTRVFTLTGSAAMRSRTASDNCRSTSITR